ncbi:MAG: MMPL family transporter [Flavobacteriales bacterium]
MEERIARIERLLTRRNAWRMLAALALISLPAVFALRHVRLDHDFEKFFPENDPELDRYLDFRTRFGNDNDYVLFGLPNAPTVFDRGFLIKVDTLAKRLGRVADVTAVSSPTRMNEPRFTPAGVFLVPWLRLDSDSTLAADSARIWQDQRMREYFFNADASAMMVLITTAPGLSKARSDSVLVGVDKAVASVGLPDVKRAGRVHGQQHYIALMEQELVTFFLSSVVLLVIFLFVAFRTGWGVGAPIAVVGLTVLWQVAMMTALGKPLSILTMLLPTILFVVGMSDAVHIIERYIEALREGLRKERALAVTFAETGLSTFITMLTTAIGYATLVTSGIRPMSEFGLFTSIGVFLAYGLAFTLLPAVLLLVPTPVRAEQTVRASLWDRNVHGLLRFTLRNRRSILIACLGVTLVSAVFIPRIKVNNFLLEDLPNSDPHKQDFLWFESDFGGVRSFELGIEVKDTTRSIWDIQVLREMEKVQRFAEQGYGVGAVISPVSIMRALNKAANGGSPLFDRLPDDDATAHQLARRAQLFGGRDGLTSIVDNDGRHARLTGRMVDEGGWVHRGKNAVLRSFLANHTDTDLIRFEQTGMAYLIDRNNERLSMQMILSLGISFLLIAGIMTWLFREPRMVLIALIPNVVPMFFIAGFMGVVGIDLKVSTAIIFSNAFGIAVDDTIHLLGKLRIELNKGKSLAYAMKRTYLSGGKAVIVMSIMLCAGFVTLIASDFGSVFYMGLLISITLAVALLAELFLLPVLVMLFMKRRPPGAA